MGWFKLWAPSGALDSRNYGAVDVASAISTPVADVEEIEVPGKNGTVIIPKNRWKNIDRTFSMFISLSNWNTIVSKLQECANGYYMLEDSWNTDHFYMARLRSFDLVSSTPLIQKGVVQIVFDCQPQRWETAGAEWADITLQQSPGGYCYGFLSNQKLMIAPSAIRLNVPNYSSEHSTIKASLSYVFYDMSEATTHSNSNYKGGMVLTAEWSNYFGNLIIDAITHSIYTDGRGGGNGKKLDAWNKIITFEPYDDNISPVDTWPSIPSNYDLEIIVTEITGTLTEQKVSVLPRWCTL